MRGALQLLPADDETALSVADVVMLRSGRNSRVVDLRVKGVTRVLQRGLTFERADVGKYILALVLDETEYFCVSGRDQVYSNGYDSCVNLAEAFALFDSVEAVERFLRANFLFSDEFVVFATAYRGETIYFDECALYTRSTDGICRVGH